MVKYRGIIAERIGNIMFIYDDGGDDDAEWAWRNKVMNIFDPRACKSGPMHLGIVRVHTCQPWFTWKLFGAYCGK